MNKVETVIINWKRPDNVERVVRALRRQSTECTVTVCDTHPDDGFALPRTVFDNADRVYRWRHNTGPYSRFVPLAAYDHEYTFFVDDDMVPGARCVEHFVAAAESLPGFGSIGQMGRVIPASGVYTPRDIPRLPRAREVDLLVRGYLVRTRNLHHVAQLRWMMNYVEERVPEDDMLLGVAMRLCAGLRNYLTPADPDPETLMNRTELPDPHALHRRPDHLARRVSFMQAARHLGWQPVAPALDVAAAGGAASRGVVSNGRAPNGRVPNGAVANGTSPNGVVVNGTGPNGAGVNGDIANGAGLNGVANGAGLNGVVLGGAMPNGAGHRVSAVAPVRGGPGGGGRAEANRGVLYLALGESYATLATASARTLRLHGYDGPVRVITDSPSQDLTDLECETLVVGGLPGGFASRFHKTQLYRWSFERTLFLDADTVIISSIEEIWETLAGHDLAMAPDMHSSVAHVLANSVTDPARRGPEYQLMRDLGLTDRRYYNSGVMLFRQGPRMADMFDRWHQEWNRFRGEDQLALVRAINGSRARVRTLDSSWNRRPKAFNSVDEARAAGVRILHFLSRQRSFLNDAYLGEVAEYRG